ncbi:ABC transporter ATP-binding protein [Streptomyces paludis]|uniref:ABC transporter ATP-binding protein n=1 Tax=Streptomyces paludis TaxID=2282738 RepID=A0A345HY78_9ACTN|nr:ATP-binding cassette domain-containing protein [Streptomyces paludis]AXG81652.1 ABC transporter ATP-binding protein [Streptomyces paludis]
MNTIAEIRDLRVEIGGGAGRAGRAIVDGVSLRVEPGGITALVGASGSGKTTTGLALLGEFPAGARVTGTVRVPEGLVGYVPQHPAAVLNPARRVDALLRDIARGGLSGLSPGGLPRGGLSRGERRAAARDRVRRALRDAQLEPDEAMLRRYPHELSGGQQQRVVLAQALLLGARVLVADEPTTGQDPLTKRLIAEQLAAVARRGMAIVLLSHDLGIVRELADEVLVMRGGAVVESGPPRRLWERPRDPWTKELLSGDDEAMATAAAGARANAPARSGRTVLEARGITVRHLRVRHTAPVLSDAALTVREGEFLAVVGRSGSGKTTLARCLAGLHRDHEGEVLLDGVPLPRSVRGRSREQLAAVQYVFQDVRAAFDEYRPVLDQVARTAVRLRNTPAPEALAEALTTLNALGLGDDTVRRRPAALSGGELQRAALARALLARPRVLICDEITSGLDTVTRRALLALLTALPETYDGLSLVLITHDPHIAARAHRVVRVADGRCRSVPTAG